MATKKPAAKKQSTKTVAVPVDVLADANKPTAKPEELKAIVDLARRMYALHVEIEKLDKELSDKNKAFNDLKMNLLPERMTAAGLKSFTLGNGYVIDIKDFISASIPTETQVNSAEGVDKEALLNRRNAGLAWLRNNNADSLIKNKLSAEFGKGEDKAAKKFFDAIEAAGYPAKCEEAVNGNTLNSFIKEQLEKGVEVPTEPFALFIGKVAKIKAPKK
jgi:hypothetical protein